MLEMTLSVNFHGGGARMDLIKMDIINVTKETKKADKNLGDYEYAMYDFTQKACYQGEVKNFKRSLGALELLKRCLKGVPVKIKKDVRKKRSIGKL